MRSSTRKLSDVARHVVIPDGIVTTAWPRVEAQCAEMGVSFDAWQVGSGKVILGKRADGVYAATVGGVVLSIPRQVGKTFLVGMIIIALCILHPNLTVLWTAHRTRTATKTFTTLQGYVRRKKIAPYLKVSRSNGIRATNGEQEIAFANGSVIMFGAREQGFGRGFDAVDIEVFDEAQILTEKALEDMVPAANQSRHESGALLFFMGTPPRPSDPGEEFTNRRKKALSGEKSNMVYIEFSADLDAGLDDRKQWLKANPSYPERTSDEAFERMRENLTDDESFRREALGIWSEVTSGTSRFIDEDEWTRTGVDEAPDGLASFGVAFSYDGLQVAVAGARRHDDGVFTELIDSLTGVMPSSLADLADWLAERKDTAAEFAISGAAGATTLAELLEARGVPKKQVHVFNAAEYFAACSGFADGIGGGTVTHSQVEGQKMLDDAVAVCDRKFRGNSGAWGWRSTSPEISEVPLEAASVAVRAAFTSKRNPGRKAKVVVM